MQFSVVIATCDRPERLRVTLARVAAAAAAPSRHELIVVDNSDTASAGPVVAAWAGTEPAVRYVRSPPRNKCAALNAGIAAAANEWLAFTDDDTLPESDWLRAAAGFAATGMCRVFGGRILPGEPDGPLPDWVQRNARGEWPGHGMFVRYYPRPASGLLGPHDPVPFGANVFVRRDVFREHGGYDEALWTLCGKAALGVDDGEFGVRLQARGEPIGYCHEAVIIHPVHHERCVLRDQVRRAYEYGWRDPMVFFRAERPALEAYELKLLVKWLARTPVDLLRRDPAAAVDDLLKLSRGVGSIVCRLSPSYRSWRAIRRWPAGRGGAGGMAR